MRKGGSKQKGAQFERSVCQRLSLWVSGMTRNDCFWRSAMSGGRATLGFKAGGGAGVRPNGAGRIVGRIKHGAQSGDISAIHEYGMPLISAFVIECKFYNRLDLETPIYAAGVGLMGGWWETLREQCAMVDKLPLLIMKGNNRDVLVLTNALGRQILDPRDRIKVRVIYPQLKARAFLFRELLALDFRKRVLASLSAYREEKAQ